MVRDYVCIEVLEAVATLLIGAAIFIFQLLFSRWWLSKHKQGPFEYLWRKATWMGYKRI